MKIYYILIVLLSVFLIAVSPDGAFSADAEVINRHGIQLGKKKMYREAIEEFSRSIEIYDKASAEVYHNKAWTNELTGNTKEAIKNYEEALRRYPKLILSGEKLGYLYYKSGDYINAVRIGENVLKIDVKNEEVRKWLPEAYLKKLEQEKKLFEDKKRKEELARKKKEEEIKKEEEKRLKGRRIFYATFDFMLRNGWFFRGDKGYKYISDPGFIVSVPESLYASFTPQKTWEFDLTLENPFLGALSPNLLIYSEMLEVLYTLGDYSLGIGMMFNHYKSSTAFQGTLGTKTLWDFKGGIIFGFKKKKMEMRFTVYPRLLPYDGSSDSKQTMDVAKYRLNYVYIVSSELKYYSIISAQDFYFFNHEAEMSDYWGVYEIGIGVTLGNIDIFDNKTKIAFTIELNEVFYLRDLDNDKPYTRKPNGQGYFGMNSGKWLKGDPMSGYWAASTQFSLRVDERPGKFYFFYQKLLIEMSDLDEDHHEFNIQFGAGILI